MKKKNFFAYMSFKAWVVGGRAGGGAMIKAFADMSTINFFSHFISVKASEKDILEF